MDPVETFLDAAESFADLVDRLPPDLDGPGLGDWDLRALVGHTCRSLITVSTYLRQPVEVVAVQTAADYYVVIAPMLDGSDAVNERGVQAGLALGEDVPGAVRQLVTTVADDLVGVDLGAVISTIAGGMRVRDYLPTRTFELMVHGGDIAAATGLPWDPPAAAVAESAELAAAAAVAQGRGADLLRLLTGRPGPPVSVV